MTAHQLLKISLNELKPGMFVHNVFNSRGVLLYSANTLIQSEQQVEALRRQGVTELNINLQKGDGNTIIKEPLTIPESKPSDDTPLSTLHELFTDEQITTAKAVRTQAVTAVKEMMSSIKTGRMFSLSSIVSSVESITESMLSNAEILMNICRLKAHDTDAYTHSVNVAVLMAGFASTLGYSHEKITAAGIGGLLHDIGLIRLPEKMFRKQSSYTQREYELFKQHPLIGTEIIQQNKTRLPDSVFSAIAQHHEKMDGSGYPAGLKDNHIEDIAYICSIADTYDTLTTQGTFNKVYLPQEALALIFQGSDADFPRMHVEHFTKLLGIFPVGSFVKLDSGEMGVVIKNNREKLLTPVVRVLFNEQGKRLTTPYIKDLSIIKPQAEDNLARILYSLDPSSFQIEPGNFILQQSPIQAN